MTKSIRRLTLNKHRSINRNKKGGMSYLSSWFSPSPPVEDSADKKPELYQVRMKNKRMEYLGTVIEEKYVPEEFRIKKVQLSNKDGVNYYKHGQGKLTIKNSDKTGDVIYIGKFKYDKKDGKGDLFDEELNNVIIENKSFGFCTYNYSGSWKNDKKHGKGTETWYAVPDLLAHFTESNKPDLLPVYTRQGIFKNGEYAVPISSSRSRSRSRSSSASHLRSRRSSSNV